MALNLSTPGVYIQEISTLPPSVAPVPTSIPVFIGYTETAIIHGTPWLYPSSAPTVPIRITSMLDYQTIFGGAQNETLHVTLANSSVDISITNQTASGSDYRLFYNLQMYFANGGGPCYIISVGDYSTTISASLMQAAIPQAEKVHEITMVVAPDALSSVITNADRRALYDAMLAHCATIHNRFAILDVKEDPTDTIANDAIAFRDQNVGANNLSFGGAYYPPYTPTLPFQYDESLVTITANNPNLPASAQAFNGQTLSFINTGRLGSEHVAVNATLDTMHLTINTIPVTTTSFSAADATALAGKINANPLLTAFLTVTIVATNDIKLTAKTAGSPAGGFTFGGTDAAKVTISSVVTGVAPDGALHSRIKSSLEAFPIVLYPSSMMAGIYCSVDSNRGVWKAPANVGTTLVSNLDRIITDEDQGGLNVDATSGKSINAIRNFPGRGILVWGARTLDGNSNEWRYVNVRRTFLFIEDSCKLATEFVVFEPNDANTWNRVKATISNFLTNLWRDGALAGSKPEQAFFVNVGLNVTMSAQDILEGRLIVQVGLAVVRPAEFIILQFEHKLQES